MFTFNPPLRTYELQTDRLFFRRLTPDDVAEWAPFCADEAALRFLPGFPTDLDSPEAKATFWINRTINRWQEVGTGQCGLIERASGKLVGFAGLLSQEVDEQPALEIGYQLMPSAWGNGFATEAAIALRNYAFENKLAEKIISIIHKDNAPSQRVAERNGMTRGHETIYKDMPVFIYSIAAPK